MTAFEVLDSLGGIVATFSTERAAKRCADITGGRVRERGAPRMSTRTRLECKCTLCGRTEPGELHAASLGIHGAEWLSPPKGWWVLLSMKEPLLRCPKCLAKPAA